MNFKKSSSSILILSGFILIMTFSFLNTTFDSETVVRSDVKPGAVRFHMTAPVLAGKLEGAQKLAEELSDHINDKFPGHNVEAFREIIGVRDVIHWFADFESEKSFNDFEALLAQDEGYKNIQGKVGLWFGGPTDKLIQSFY